MNRNLSEVDYLEIEEHGVIGNCLTAALVGIDGRIDWFCYPYFDSPSIFGSLLDHNKGGFFKIHPACSPISTTQSCDIRYKQFYWPDTNILVTRFITEDGIAEVIDYMPIDLKEDELGFRYLVRRVHVTRGKLVFRMHCLPAFNYGRDSHTTQIIGEKSQRCIFTTTSCPPMQLLATVPFQVQDNGVVAEFVVKEGSSHIFAFGEIHTSHTHIEAPNPEKENELFLKTVSFWRSWISKCTYKGRWREKIHRSALVLKLHCFQKTGAVVASPTCCLPTRADAKDARDNRLMWVRDTSFTIYALLRIGFTEEAKLFIQWLKKRCKEATELLKGDSIRSPLHHVYSINDTPIPCEVLSHLEGYKGSGPPRIGQPGVGQTQLDVYGDLMDAVYLYNKYAVEISYDMWQHLAQIIDWLCDHWQEPDANIWNSDTKLDHYTYSKVMCWVAVDRALRLADRRSFPANRQKWMQVRDEIYLEIMNKGWSEEKQAFVQAYGTQKLDAAVLIMPLVFFMAPSDPRMVSTLDQILKPPKEGLRVSNCLVFKYQPDKAMVQEGGTYNVCSFWMIEALTRAGKTNPEKLKYARLFFEEMIGYANHVGLFSEEIGTRGQHLGNYPHALVHFAMISAAFNLDRVLK
mmetsp:Transcript_5362/g.7534  ORF Transcript_5362/g.7534 Transcript_5362/m.7534 type:complete len:631 (+) Transcript_5362:189-2081(+)|eukprot:CAMPEP_0168570816 /NCGR_PEP_ID=MMETSP0413-20121227/16960_1 /TAXON_ID=136452 /ORGANISM="Filamoeba nolandi, Strain NC-AS-23-1" /LENGTH=630 /DNA_ID=CAMNT_0008603539 /DNA_START=146 /DNA_END=2038 /DNA_ORIENTATION=+